MGILLPLRRYLTLIAKNEETLRHCHTLIGNINAAAFFSLRSTVSYPDKWLCRLNFSQRKLARLNLIELGLAHGPCSPSLLPVPALTRSRAVN
jgi:hypothetical protein